MTDLTDPNFDFAASCATARATIEVMGSAIEGTAQPLVVNSGILLLRQGNIRSEDKPETEGFAGLRGASEEVAPTLAKKGVRAMIVRLSPTVHGEGDKEFFPMLIAAARKSSASRYIGEGLSRWTAIHRLDAARLYRLGLEKGQGGVYHGVAEESVFAKDIAAATGRRLNMLVELKIREEAAAQLGFSGYAFSIDSPASNMKTRSLVGIRGSLG